MDAYMTNGTFDFLKKMKDDHPKINFYYMKGDSSTLVYYESNDNKNIFTSGRAYETVVVNGELQEEGFVVMNNIPVTDEGVPILEDRFKKRQKTVDSTPGFQAFRLLRPKKGNTYVVLTQWASEDDFENWKNSDQFKKAHKDGGAGSKPAYFPDRPFITSYHMINLDE